MTLPGASIISCGPPDAPTHAASASAPSSAASLQLPPPPTRAVGQRLHKMLRDVGLRPRAVEALLGQAVPLAHWPAAALRVHHCVTPAALVIRGCALGHWVDHAALRNALGAAYAELVALELLITRGASARTRFGLLPLPGGLLAQPWLDDPVSDAGDLPWPDDSTHHLAGALTALPPTTHHWLDVGAANGVLAHLANPRGQARVASEANPRLLPWLAWSCAMATAPLAPVMSQSLHAMHGQFDCISWNAPLPTPHGPPPAPTTTTTTTTTPVTPALTTLPATPALSFWRFGQRAEIVAFLRAAPAHLTKKGTLVMHAAFDANAMASVQELGGRAHWLRYATDADDAITQSLAVLWWQPHQLGPQHHAVRTLTARRPHVDHQDSPTWVSS